MLLWIQRGFGGFNRQEFWRSSADRREFRKKNPTESKDNNSKQAFKINIQFEFHSWSKLIDFNFYFHIVITWQNKD